MESYQTILPREVATLLVTGCPGVGKSEVSLAIGSRCSSVKLVVIDLDRIAQIFPFEPTEPFFELVEANLEAIIPAYLRWMPDAVLICGVIVDGALSERVRSVVTRYLTPRPKLVALTATESEIKKRIENDQKRQDKVGRLRCYSLDRLIRSSVSPEDIIDTSAMSVDEVAVLIDTKYLQPALYRETSVNGLRCQRC